jgi:hypothetical protein
MVTQSEQERKTEEQVVEPVSKETDAVSEAVTEDQEVITFTTQAELDKYIQDKATPIAQGLKDKEMKTYYDSLSEARNEAKSLKAQLEDKAEDSLLDTLEKSQAENWGDNQETRNFQEAVRQERARERKVRQRESDAEVLAAKQEEVSRHQSALQKALKLFLPENPDFISDVESFAEKLSQAETEREMELIFQVEEAKVKARAEGASQAQRVKPDGGVPSAPGGQKTESQIIKEYADNPKDRDAKKAYVDLMQQRRQRP